MSFMKESLGLKRKRAASDAITPDERPIYDLIMKNENMGIWKGDIRKELKIANVKLVDNCIKSLLAKKKIKEVANIQAKGKKRLMGAEIVPSAELTGGDWYEDGILDSHLIDALKMSCKNVINQQKVATADLVQASIKRLNLVKDFELSVEHVKQILDNLCLDKEVIRVKSNGLGEFVSFPINAECYKIKPKRRNVGALGSIPCGSCPHINMCTPDGIISPLTCVYYSKWLEF